MKAFFDAFDAMPEWKFYGVLWILLVLIAVADRVLARRWAR